MPTRYSPVQIMLHWTMAVVMIAAYLIGSQFEDMPRGPDKISLIGWHALLGLTVLILLVPRVFLRRQGVPPLPPDMPVWQQRLAHAVHVGLYAVMVLLPIAGLMALLAGRQPMPVPFIGEIPVLFASPMLHEGAEEVHAFLGNVWLGLVILHVAATVWHAFKKDGLATRMVPFGGTAIAKG